MNYITIENDLEDLNTNEYNENVKEYKRALNLHVFKIVFN